MTANTSRSVQSQAQSQKSSSKKSNRRHLDHLPDLQDGVPFTMVPRPLLTAWIEGLIPDKKMKLLCILLSHADSFKVRRNYLLKRFDKATLSKYMKELESEGFIRVEKVPLEGGGWENLHHVNPIAEWTIPSHAVEERSNRPSIQSPVDPIAPLNETKDKTKKKNNDINDDDGELSQVDDTSLGNDRQKESSSSSAVGLAVRLEWLYKKSSKGTYDWRTANTAAEQFLKSFGPETARSLESWLDENALPMKGRVKVRTDMFSYLYSEFQKAGIQAF